MTKQQINKTINQHFLVLKPKENVGTTRTTRKTKQTTLRELILGLTTRLDKIEANQQKDHDLLSKVIKLNDLKTR